MTSSQLSDDSIPDRSGLQIGLFDPTVIILPLPKSQSEPAPMQIFFDIGNYAAHSIPYVYGILAPELLNSAGQVIQPQQLVASQNIPDNYQDAAIPPRLYGKCIPRQAHFGQALSARLFWQNHSLHLQVDLFTGYLADGSLNTYRPDHSHSSWLFADLSPGTYQMQLSYTKPAFAFTLVEGVKTISFAATTPTTMCSAPIELRLVEQSPNNPVLEVEGVCFETIVATKPILIPPPQSGVSVPIELGLRIPNHSSTPYRFGSYASSSQVEMMKNQEPLTRRIRGGASLGFQCPTETDFHWLATGESLTLPATAFLEWKPEGKLVLFRRSLGDHGFGAWVIGEPEGLESGTYQIRVTYRTVSEGSFLTPFNYEELWYGMAYTPFKTIELVDN